MGRIHFSLKNARLKAFPTLIPWLLIMLMLRSTTVEALGVGEIELHSALNQPLDAEINLVDFDKKDLEELRIGIAGNQDYARAGVERLSLHKDLRFTLATRADGTPYISVHSLEPIREPFLDFILAIDWSRGHVLREFTLLLDPPVLTEEQPAPVAAAVTEVPVAENVSRAPAPKARPVPASPSASGAVSAGPAQQAMQGLVYGPTSRNDTLWSIADKIRPDRSVSVQQMMMALLRENPDAFYDQNVNGLKAGYILRVKDIDGIKSVSRQQAENEARLQNQQWSALQGGGRVTKAPTGITPENLPAAGSKAATVAAAENDAQLKIVAPPASGEIQAVGADAEQLQGKEEELAKIRQELALAKESSDATEQENEDLQSRLTALEGQIATMQRLIALKDDTLARLQSQIDNGGQAEEQPAGQAPATGAVSPETAGSEEAPPAAEETAAVPGESPAAPLAAGQESAKEARKTPVPAARKEARAPQSFTQSMVNRLLGNPLVSAIVVFVILILVTLTWLVVRQRRLAALEETAMPYEMGEAGGTLVAAEADAVADRIMEEEGQPAVEAFTAAGLEESAAEVGEIDPVAEADVYVAYKRYQQAIDLLKGAVEHDPDRLDLRIKLLEVYRMAEDREAFITEAETLYTMVEDGSDPRWQQVLEMGHELAPEHPMFSEPGASSTDNVVRLDGGLVDSDTMDSDLAGDDDVVSAEDRYTFDGGSTEESTIDISEPGEQYEAENVFQENEFAASDDDQESSTGDQTDEDELIASVADEDEGIQDTHTIEFERGLLDSGDVEEEDRKPAVLDEVDNSIEFSSDDQTSAAENEEPVVDEGEIVAIDGGEDEIQLQDELPDASSEVDEFEISADLDDNAKDQDDVLAGADSGESRSTWDNTVVSLGSAEIGGQQDSAWIEEPAFSEQGQELENQAGPDNDMVSDPEVVATKLDLARAYIDMGDADGAKGILDEIMAEGNENQKGEARGLLRQLG